MSGPHVLTAMADVPEALRAALSDRYTLQDELGRGGMATVYRAQDLRRDRCVALKILHAEVAAAVGRERFLREIEIVKRLNHPHILPLLDSGEAGAFLYYAMPCVEGESLQDRIAREGQLPLADVIAIARDVALALAHAHQHGIVHRDVKPGNILLSGRSAVIADFGIARVLGQAADEGRLTSTGLTVGTPLYMAPEQAASAKRLDGRADLYSLACVVYEMLAGVPPFTGSTTQAIQARHALDPPPPLHTVRPGVPPAVERAVLQGLAKVPADRLATTVAFVEALTAPDVTPYRRTTGPGWRRWAIAAAGGIAVAAAGWFFVRPLIGAGAAAADTTRYVVLPFERQGTVASLEEDDLLTDALSRWTGITVVPQVQVQEAVRRYGGATGSARAARRVASGMSAGRLVRGRVSVSGDSVRIWAGLYGLVPADSLIRQASVRLGAGSVARDAPSAFALLADSLLFGEVRTRQRPVNWTGTRSAPARQAYGRGHAAVEEWNLPAADSAFAAAAEIDPQYAQAHLWLAQVRAWGGAAPMVRSPSAMWRSAAERAAAGRARLSGRDRLMADALVALARNDLVRACARWRDLTRADSLDFAGWYSLGNCLAGDDAVIADPANPARRRFRTSYHEATQAFARAYRLQPSVHRALQARSYASVRTILWTRSNRRRQGVGVPPDTTTYFAYPEWRADTLAFVPFPAGHVPIPSTLELAVRQGRQLFHDVALAWVAAHPTSVEALEALALSLEMLHDPAALDTIRHARALATDPVARIRTASAEVWMTVRFSAPDDLEGLRAAEALADSVLRLHPARTSPEPLLLASLAALTGRASLAAAHMRHGAVRKEWTVPPPLTQTAPALLLFAALGGPVDSLRALEQAVIRTIDRDLPHAERAGARAEWLARALSLAFPHYRSPVLTMLAGSGDYLVDAQAAWMRGDSAAVRRMFRAREEGRRTVPPEEITLDGVYPEAALLAEIGDTAKAIAWLDPTLGALGATAPQMFADPTRAGALAQSMALRADLADGAGDPVAAARWRRAVDVLWAHADPFLKEHRSFAR